MTRPNAAAAPGFGARPIGVVYLLYFLTAILSVYLARGLVVPGDGATTAANLLAHESLFRAGLAIGLVGNLLYVALTALFYAFFKPVDRAVSLLAAFFSLVGCAVQTFGGVFQLAPLIVLSGDGFLSAFRPEELQAVALLSFKLYAQTFYVGLVFFACYDLFLGYLVFRSGFLPRFLGVFMMLAGIGWLCFLWPPAATALAGYILPFGFLAELLLMLWLIVKGAGARRPHA